VRTVAEAVGTPGFAPALAQEMAQLVRVNAQRAELHLHPAEMGPIDVRLHMQDNQVSVTMVAADAQTRDAMQQALPQLREALAREGLALADASVHDQPRREPGAPPAPPRTPRDGDFAVRGVDAAADVASAVRARRLVDLYA
jgi:flagellar hook-length control protein FliK